MKKSNYKKSLILKLYLKALLYTPYIYKNDRKNIVSHNNALYTLQTLLLNRPYCANIFESFNAEEENEFIETNIKLFNSHKDYNDLIINANIEDLSYKEAVINLRDLLDNETYDDITYEEMLELTHDYYNSLPDNEIRKVFNNVYKERNDNIRITNESSFSFLMPTIDYSLITLGANNETYKNMLYDLVHEYGHLIQTGINRNLSFYSEEYHPAELMPVFFNMLSTFYFDNNLNSNIERNIIQMQASIFIDQVKYTKEIIDNGIDAFKEKYNELAIDLYFDNSILQVYSYLIPMLTSFELLKIYKEDPEKSMFIIKQLIMDNKDYIDLLKDHKIELGSNTNEAIKMLKK